MVGKGWRTKEREIGQWDWSGGVRGGEEERRQTYPQTSVPFLGELWSASNRLVPDHWKISDRTKILCDRDAVVQV